MSKGLDRRSEEASKRATSLEESAERLFNDLDQRPYLAGPYLDHLRENLRDLGAAFGRSLTLSLLVLAAFELLTRAAVNRASLGPFEISDLSLIQKALPVIASYLFYDLMTIAFHGGVVSLVYQRILQLLHPKLEKPIS